MQKFGVLALLATCAVSLKVQTYDDPETVLPAKNCGIVLGAFSQPKYVISQVKFALSIAKLTMPKRWCTESPDLEDVPVVIFSDVPDAANIAASVPTNGLKVNFQVVDMGNLTNPKPPFHVPAKGIRGGIIPQGEHHAPYWYWRPQMLRQSPFKITMAMDDDVSPCSGQGLATAFGLLKRWNVDYTGPQWRHKIGKFNHGLMILNRDRAAPWIDEWERLMTYAISEKCLKFRGDQGVGNMAWKSTPQANNVRRAVCPESVCCAHYTPLPKCSRKTCLVHHDHSKGPYDDDRIDNGREYKLSEASPAVEADLDEGVDADHDADADGPKPDDLCR